MNVVLLCSVFPANRWLSPAKEAVANWERRGGISVFCCTISGWCWQGCILKKFKIKKWKIWTVCPLSAPRAFPISLNYSDLQYDWLRYLLWQGSCVPSCKTHPAGIYGENSCISINLREFIIHQNKSHSYLSTDPHYVGIARFWKPSISFPYPTCHLVSLLMEMVMFIWNPIDI